MTAQAIYKTIPEQIEEHLKNEILTGSLIAGQALREQEISERFGVSRGPIREALMKLTQQGLLTSEANKGVRVAEKPSSSVRPLVAKLRQQIEVFVLDSSFDSITSEDLTLLTGILEDFKDACEQGDADALVNHDLRFHKTIIEIHDDKDIYAMWNPIMLRMLISYDRFGDDLMQSYHEHKNILDYIKAGDKEAALEALVLNIQ